MKGLAGCLWQDEHRVILSAEIVIVGTVPVIGLITDMTSLQRAVNAEMGDLADKFDCLDQSCSFAGQGSTICRSGGRKASFSGSLYRNCKDQVNVEFSEISKAGSEMPTVTSPMTVTSWPYCSSCRSSCRTCAGTEMCRTAHCPSIQHRCTANESDRVAVGVSSCDQGMW